MTSYAPPDNFNTIFNDSEYVATSSTTSNTDSVARNTATTALVNSKYEMHTGLLTGGVVSINGSDNKKIDITGGIALIVDYTTPTSISTKTISWTNQVGLTPTVSGFAVWVAVYDNAGTTDFYYTTDPTPLDRRNKAFIARIWSTVGSTATQITNRAPYLQPAYALAQSFQDFTLGISSLNLEGNVFSAGTLLKLNKSSGKSYRYWTDPNNVGYENTHIDAAITDAGTYNYHIQNSNITTTKTNMDFDNWDNAGVSAVVSTGYWTVQEIWYYPVSQVLGIIYGQKQYSTLESAFLGASKDDKIRNTALLQGAIFRGYVIGQKGITTLANAFFIAQSTINAPMLTSGLNYQIVNKTFSFNDIGTVDFTYIGGFYNYSATSQQLTIGGTTTKTFGTSQVAYGGYAFAVSSNTTANALVLTVKGRSVSDSGSYTDNDSEVLIANTQLATTDKYYQTTKKWIGTITYELSGTSGSFTFNYGLCNFYHGDKDFYITSFDVNGRSQGNGSNFDIQLYHHRPAGWTYSDAAFVPNGSSNVICSMLTDYGYSNIASDEYFSYTRENLNSKCLGSQEEGFIIKVTETVNNAFRYGTVSVNMLI